MGHVKKFLPTAQSSPSDQSFIRSDSVRSILNQSEVKCKAGRTIEEIAVSQHLESEFFVRWPNRRLELLRTMSAKGMDLRWC